MGEMELINLDTKTKTIIYNGEITRIPVEYCDNCSSWQNAVYGSFQRGLGGEKLMWFCSNCK
jgi:hypothetical protein